MITLRRSTELKYLLSQEEGKTYPKVLVAAPTYAGKHYIFRQFYEAISNLEYPNYSFIIVDNTDDNKAYYTKLKRSGYKNIYRTPRGGNSRNALSISQNFIRQKFIEGGYDYLLSVESDLIPPVDVIQKLMKHQAPIIGSVYYLMDQKTGYRVPCIFFVKINKDGVGGTRLISRDEIPDYLSKGVKKVHGVGLGCTLIRRDIVERFSFWTDERFTNKHSDVYFFMELHNAKIPVYVDTDLIVPHFPSDWRGVADR